MKNTGSIKLQNAKFVLNNSDKLVITSVLPRLTIMDEMGRTRKATSCLTVPCWK